MSTYEIWRIEPASQKIIQRAKCGRIDAARRAGHRFLAQMDVGDERAQHLAANAISIWTGASELVALVGNTELHMFKG